MQMAKKDEGIMVEQFWSVEGQNRLLSLQVKADNEGDPAWSLSMTDLAENKLMWQHRTSDTGLIHSLIVAESTGQVTAVSTPLESRQMGASITLGVGPEDAEPVKQETKIFRPKNENFVEEKEAVLQGDINKVQLPNVMQSIQMGRLTGRLAVRSEGRGVDVYFDDGEPVHASDGVDTGAEVIIDMMSLNSGKFRFIPDERTVERTIDRRLDGLIMEAVTLVDQSAFLEREGLTMEAYLICKNPNITFEEYSEIISKGPPVDDMLQRVIFKDIGEFKTLLDLLRSKPLKRSEWVPIIFNLVTLNLVSISDKPPTSRKTAQLGEMAQVDFKTLEQVLKPLMRYETGILTYPAFQYFVAQECFRYELCGMPLSVLVFSMKKGTDGGAADALAAREIMAVIGAVKRPIDMIGHFQMFDYAMVLPNTGTRSAAVFAQKIHEAVGSAKFSNDTMNQHIVMCFGIAGIPENCRSMGQLLSAASEAKKHAESSMSPVVLYQNLQIQG